MREARAYDAVKQWDGQSIQRFAKYLTTLLDNMVEKSEEQKLIDMFVKMRPELYAKYNAQSIKVTNVPYLIEIVSSIEANEAYIRTLIGKRKAPERSH